MRKLIRRLGPSAAWGLICLFLWAASNRSNGILCGMKSEDIELAADWAGEGDAFTQALADVGFLDNDGDHYLIHGWAEHNPWAAGAEARSAKARWNAIKGHHSEAEANRLVPGYAAVRCATSNASSADVASGQQTHSNAPSPSLSLSLSLSPSPKGEVGKPPVASPDTAGLPTAGAASLPACPADQLVDLYHKALPELPQCRVMTAARLKALKTRWRWVLTTEKSVGTRRAESAAEAFEWFRKFFDQARESDFLMGRITRSAGHTGWKCDLEYLLGDKGLIQVIEKTEAPA